ncbi:er lumen protein retaining receptor-like protein, partial [Trifolium pratense]
AIVDLYFSYFCNSSTVDGSIAIKYRGVSLKTQELYALVFAARYLDIFTNYISLYNTVMKLIFLGSSFSIVWYMRYHKIVRRSYDKDQDTFRHYFLVLPCLVLALLINEKFTFKEVMWTFSLYLEAVAILPQLVLLQRTRNIDNLTGQYVFLLGYSLSSGGISANDKHPNNQICHVSVPV